MHGFVKWGLEAKLPRSYVYSHSASGFFLSFSVIDIDTRIEKLSHCDMLMHHSQIRVPFSSCDLGDNWFASTIVTNHQTFSG